MAISVSCQRCRPTDETVNCPYCYKLNPNPPLQQRSSTGDPGSGPSFHWGKLKKFVSQKPDASLGSAFPTPYQQQKNQHQGMSSQNFLSQKPAASPGSAFPIPYQQQTNQPQGLRSLIKNKVHKATVAPSLNYELSGPSPTRSKKRAVICGITYNNRKYKLKGTINDVKNMRELLINRFGYPRECIRVLTEEETDIRCIPTRKNIEDSLRWLVDGCRQGDSLAFLYSGHSLRRIDSNNGEVDGFDETICPVDFLEEGMIVDNDLNSLIVRPLNQGVTLHAIVGSSPSGNILDLPNSYFSLENKWKDNSPPSGVFKGTNGGLAISISACVDNQAAADQTTAFNGKMNGALTYILSEVLKVLPGPTYGDLFDLIHESIDKVNQGCVVNTKVLRSSKLSLTPLLSSSHKFDVYKRHLFL